MSPSHSNISASQRIRELAVINNDISVMLLSAGKAVNALSNRPLDIKYNQVHGTSDSDNGASPRDQFESDTRSYLETLQGICARLNRQAYALEEAGIIAAEAPILTLADARKGAAGGSSVGVAGANAEGNRIKNGGLGNFDVGWLNSRGNKVGAEMEAEIMSQARTLCETWDKGRSQGDTSKDDPQSDSAMSTAEDVT